MAFGLYSLLEAALLVLNAMCVLHEERFLAKVSQACFYKELLQWFCCRHCSGSADKVLLLLSNVNKTEF